MSEFTELDISQMMDSILISIDSKPLKLGVIGTSGVGKSSTINALFGSDLEISHTVACTKEFKTVPIDVDLSIAADKKKALLHVVDAPGLGESLDTDPLYLSRYREELPSCDGVLWLLAARNRGLALDQQYVNELYDYCPNVIFGINQVDTVDPLDWESRLNLPSEVQLKYIKEIEKDRKEKIGSVVQDEVQICSFSARKKYNLSILFSMFIDSLPTERRALYDLIRNFKVEDQFPEEALDLLKKSAVSIELGTLDKVKNFLRHNILPRGKNNE